MKEMQMMQGAGMMDFPDSYNLVINANHPLIATRLASLESEEAQNELALQLSNLALLQQGMLKGKSLSDFIKKTLERI
jgi:molecular chaperone HtpG